MLRSLLLVLALCQAILHAADTAEDALIAAARTPGPGQAKALARLGDELPGDAKAVAGVLADGVVSTDAACRIYAGQAIRSLLTRDAEDNPFPAALAAHADRLLTAAEAAMSDRINPALEALGGIETPSGALTPRLIALLAPGKPFRRYTVGALARSRPLTPEIRRVVLAEANGGALVQQDLVIAIQTWPDAELLGDDIDQALAVLADAVMGNIPPRVNEILKRRGQPSARVAARLQEILMRPTTTDSRFGEALAGYAACAAEGEEMELIGRLLAADPKLDPDRAGCVVRHLDGRQGLPPALQKRLAALAQDRTQDWWLRHHVARLQAAVPGIPADLSERPAWIVAVDSASHWPKADIDRGLANAGGAEERVAWAVVQRLHAELAAHEQEKDFQRRRGAIVVAAIAKWVEEHRDAASMPFVVCRMLDGYTANFAATPEEQAQCIAYVTGLITGGALAETKTVDMRYPQGGPGGLSRKVYDAMVWACRPASRQAKEAQAASPWLVARCEAARLLHAMRPPPRLLLLADRELASALRSFVREEQRDMAICRTMLQDSGFSLMPVPQFMAELAAFAGR